MRERCTETTRGGTRCKRLAAEGETRCGLHATDRYRPSLTDEAVEKLLAMLRAGAYIEQACTAAGVSRRTYYDWWRRGDPAGTDPAFARLREFRAAAGQAQSEAEVRQVVVIADAARTTWQAAAWLLERRYPERWARPSQRTEDEAKAEPVEPVGTDPFAEVDELAKKRRQR